MKNKLITLFLFLLLGYQATAQVSVDSIAQLETSLGDSSFFGGHVTGFVLFDLYSSRVVFEKNSHQRFIPASTVKLLTLLASLNVLQDSTQTLRYVSAGDTLKIWGSGDPSWLYKNLVAPDFKKIIGQHTLVQFSDANQVSPNFGYGWQWDDYYYDYAAERSSLPMYGNLVQVDKAGDSLQVTPAYFQPLLTQSKKSLKELERDFHTNTFSYNPKTYVGREKFIPFLSQPEVLVELATTETGINWIYKADSLPADHQLWRASPLLPILKEMMLESDNFLAEQLLFMVSDKLFKSLDSDRAIEEVLKTQLNDLPDAPRWVDGSGLSRHNLVTPRTMMRVVEKLYRQVPREQLLQLLATGGKTGTLKNSFASEKPYIFAKTGSMSHSYNLAGIVQSMSGKQYAFAFMNTNFPYPVSRVRKEVEKVMIQVREQF